MKKLVLCLVTAALATHVLPTPALGGGGDPLLDRQWGLDSIHAPAAWKHSRGAGAVIAILDSGVDLQHPDLRPNLQSKGFDFIRSRVGADDRSGHGTAVTGVAAARGGNGIGVSGVAPRARILPVKVCSLGDCSPKAAAKGIRYATRHGADVINMSFYVPKADEGLTGVLEAVSYAERRGVVVVAAAGNSREPWCVEPASSALCVGAVTRDDQRALYSNGDLLMTDNYLVAPGGEGVCENLILTTSIGGRDACKASSRYAYNTGTSLAAPFVAGVAALLAAKGATGEEIRTCVLETAEDLGPQGRDPIYGFGRVDALGAVRCAEN